MSVKKVAEMVHQKLAHVSTILVDYDYIVGFHEMDKQTLIELDDKNPKDAIHEYFKDFWGTSTIVEKKGWYYAEKCWQAAIKIRGWHDMPPEEAEILKKHGIY